jgi:hypothetical protein
MECCVLLLRAHKVEKARGGAPFQGGPKAVVDGILGGRLEVTQLH